MFAFFADECIDMPVNDLDPLIRRFNALDRELGLNVRELEGRNAAEVSEQRQQGLRDAMNLEL
jgi:hypothetical protein